MKLALESGIYSYSSLRKLDQFFTRLQAIPDLHHALTPTLPSDPSSKILDSLNPEVQSSLHDLIKEIFTLHTVVRDSGGA